MTFGCERQRLVRHGATLLGLLAAVVASTASEAQAYRTFADDPEVGYPARWHSNNQVWELSAANLERTGLSEAEALAALRAAFATLEAPPCEHALPAILVDGMSASSPTAEDGRNTIAFVTDWSARGLPPSRGATTELQLRRRDDGYTEITEADIYLNLEEFQFGLAASEAVLDLQSVATHEGAHALGGLHVCEDDGTGGAPLCSGSATFASSILFPNYVGEQARALAVDDVQLLCDLYPLSSRPCVDPCGDGHECRAGVCVSTAPPMCAESTDCRDGVCAVYGEGAGTCTAAGAQGAPCTTGNECSSRVCLTESSVGAPFCTNRCGTATDCATGERCVVVEGTPVCAPPPASCTVAPGPSRTQGLGFFFFVTLSGLSVHRRAARKDRQ